MAPSTSSRKLGITCGKIDGPITFLHYHRILWGCCKPDRSLARRVRLPEIAMRSLWGTNAISLQVVLQKISLWRNKGTNFDFTVVTRTSSMHLIFYRSKRPTKWPWSGFVKKKKMCSIKFVGRTFCVVQRPCAVWLLYNMYPCRTQKVLQDVMQMSCS